MRRPFVQRVDWDLRSVEDSPFLDMEVKLALLESKARVYSSDTLIKGAFIVIDGGRATWRSLNEGVGGSPSIA